jgi:G3E family GTPase
LLILLAVPQPMTPRQKRPPAPFPLTVVTGFLGAGKTSLLNALLRDPALAGTLVIVNEFGEIGLDHLLVERLDGDMLLMTSGCLCCSIRGDLIATLEDILRRRDNGRIAPFQRVMIETTGLADPAPVLHTVMAHPYFILRFRVDGVITLVDTVNGNATLDAHEEAVKQAAMADRLVLSKTDLLTAGSGALRDLRARLKKLNPGAVLLDAAKGEALGWALLDAGIYDPDRKIPDVRRWLNAEAFAARGAHDLSVHVHRHPHGDAAKAKAKNATLTGTTPAFAPSACATRRRWRRLLSICSLRCCERRTGPGSCASRVSWRSATIPRGRSSSRASSMCFTRHCGSRSGLTPITAPAWFLFCATWNRLSSKLCGRR